MIGILLALAVIFAELSMLAFGGGYTIIPEMQRQLVAVHHWMTAEQFGAAFALAQAAPGPNMMIVPLLGWRIAGLPGLLTTSAANFGPSSILCAVAFRFWEKHRDQPWRRRVQAGLLPVTAGLVAASAALIIQATAQGWGLILVVAACAALSLRTGLHPLWLLAGGALVGLAGIGQG